MKLKKPTAKQAMKINSRLAIVLIAFVVLSLISKGTVVEVISVICALLALIAACVISALYWRCAHCGKMLGQGRDAQWHDMDYCPYCGKRIE